jgi:predicted ester cyclase
MDKYASAKESTNKATSVVKSFLDALNKSDFQKAREFIHENLSFIGVLGKVDGADTYISQMEKMQLKYDIRKIFTNEPDVAVFYDIKMGEQNVFAAGWYSLDGDLIHTIRVVFDPRNVM